ncbi:MAG: four helix bundle protein [Phycisphaerae bacterium]
MVWQKAMDLVVEAYKLSELFPARERFGLTAQIRDAVAGIPGCMVEGHCRRTSAGFGHFLDIARGSSNEVETQRLLSVRLRYVTDQRADPAARLVDEVQRLLNGLVSSPESSPVRDIRHRYVPGRTAHNSQLTTENSRGANG